MRWSPLQRAGDWQDAQTVAEAMTGAAEIEHDAGHWTERVTEFRPGRVRGLLRLDLRTAAAHEQQLLAPLVAGLLTNLRHAVYGASWQGGRAPWPPVLLLLDKCAKVAPIPDLPAMLSEAGSQGLQVICVFQDISQVRRRWPREADGFMSLFGAKIILSCVADPKTLEQLSLLCGDWDCPVQTLSEQRPAGGRPVTTSPDAVIAR